jgi:hypothetical protein
MPVILPAVYELELLNCKFCPGVLKPDVTRKQKVPGFRFYRCEACERPNIFSATSPPERKAAPQPG